MPRAAALSADVRGTTPLLSDVAWQQLNQGETWSVQGTNAVWITFVIRCRICLD